VSKKRISDQVKEQSVLGTASIAKDKRAEFTWRNSGPANFTTNPQHKLSIKCFQLDHNLTSSGTLAIASCLIGILRHREALCVWVLLLARS